MTNLLTGEAERDQVLAFIADYQGTIRGAQELLEDEVREARKLGYSWSQIGEAMQVSKQAAHERYRHVDAHD